MNNIKLNQLRHFRAVVEQGSVAQAAKTLFCVPSNVTARIRELEEVLGTVLFHREGKRLVLTPNGRRFYGEAVSIIQRVDHAAGLFDEKQAQWEMYLGALDVSLFDFLPARLPKFRVQYPQVKLDICCRPSSELEAAVLAGEMDLVITDGPIEHPLLESCPAYRERMCLITPLNRGGPGDAMTDLDIFGFGTNCSYRVRMDEWALQQGVGSGRSIRVESYHVIFQYVKAGLGLSWFPLSMLNQIDPGNTVERYEMGDSELFFVWRRGREQPEISTFMDFFMGQES
ncbi:transcriptional regulator [Marinobacter lipolyticus SM19]|uniref:Transcriptional regulator n=1 Tax=Marinobacter lipolyticus SM19 TaxID=1318628 RepID=R8B061_9GAMM|nr:LysR family transcriptional regulator [Marinobacter lipolyticus]EON91990.1 transcriptional regulator [Marinobacter lipolyticus SM19]